MASRLDVSIVKGIFSGTSTLDAPFIKPFSVVAINGQRIREVSYTSPAPFTVDVRRISVGGVAIESTPIPEPGTFALLASTLIPLGLGFAMTDDLHARSKQLAKDLLDALDREDDPDRLAYEVQKERADRAMCEPGKSRPPFLMVSHLQKCWRDMDE